MREIKFRAWDIDHKCFVHFDLNNPDEQLFGIHGVLENTVVEPWQQYTGIKVNGKELYEGDILRNKHGDLRLLMHSTDVPQDNKKQSKYWVGWVLKCLDNDPEEYYGLYLQGYKVIGNKCENPELFDVNSS